MTNPVLAHQTDNGRYYRDPSNGEMYMSVTNALDCIDKAALVGGAVKVTAQAAWDHLPRMVAHSRETAEGPCATKRVSDRCGNCRFCLTAQIKAEHKHQWEHARDFGSLVHDHAEAKVTGKPIVPDDDVEPFIDQYLAWADRFGVDLDSDVEFTELTVFHRKLRYAGTADLGVHLRLSPDGEFTPRKRWLWLVDFKSSLRKPANVVYREQPLQLAALRFPEVLMGPDDSEHPVPKYAGAAVLNLRSDSFGFIPLPADKQAHAGFVACLNLAYYLHGQDLKGNRPIHTEPIAALIDGKVA